MKTTIKELLETANDLDHRESILLLAKAINRPEAYVLAHKEAIVADAGKKRFLRFATARRKHKPIAYIVGNQPFLGYNFKVNGNVLIPRPETERLAEFVLDSISKIKKSGMSKRGTNDSKKTVVIVDVGTGSGCIACSLKKRVPDATVIASDLSPLALSVVKYNCNKLSTDIKIIHSNLFDKRLANELSKKIDSKESVALFIVANLPYLPYSDQGTMQKDVVRFEPKNALFAKEDGMYLIQKCIQQLKLFLLPYPKEKLFWELYFEIDPRQRTDLKKYLRQIFPKAKPLFLKDLCGRERFMKLIQRG